MSVTEPIASCDELVGSWAKARVSHNSRNISLCGFSTVSCLHSVSAFSEFLKSLPPFESVQANRITFVTKTHKHTQFREIKTLDNSNLNSLTHFYGVNHHLKLLSININIKINLEYKGTIIHFLRPTGIVHLCNDRLAHTHTSRTSPYQTWHAMFRSKSDKKNCLI